MKKKFIILLIVLAILSSFSLSGCDMSQQKPVEPVDFYLNMATCELDVFETVSLETVDYYYEKIDLAVTWKSSKESVAVVSGGLVKAVGEGQTAVSAECNGVTATCYITVNNSYCVPEITLKALTPDSEQLDIFKDDIFNLLASLTYKNIPCEEAVFHYNVSGENAIISVSQDGNITGLNIGSATLTVTAEWENFPAIFMSKTITVTVKEFI